MGHRRGGTKPNPTNIPGLLVDDVDRDIIERRQWQIHKLGYVCCTFRVDGSKPKFHLLHRVIMERVAGRPLTRADEVDHINRNKLDNRRENLRFTTRALNQQNRDHMPAWARSGIRHVHWIGSAKRYRATIMANGKKYFGPFCTTAEEAAKYIPSLREQANYGKEPGRDVAFG